jgi:phage-related protein
MSDLTYDRLVSDKPLVWLEGEIKTPPFSAQARLKAGFLLRLLQQGENMSMPDSRPMPSIGPNCHELRIVDGNVGWRIVYYFAADAVVILEVFKKKSQTTPKKFLDAARSRLKAYRELTED